jgi:hypothetical protein
MAGPESLDRRETGWSSIRAQGEEIEPSRARSLGASAQVSGRLLSNGPALIGLDGRCQPARHRRGVDPCSSGTAVASGPFSRQTIITASRWKAPSPNSGVVSLPSRPTEAAGRATPCPLAASCWTPPNPGHDLDSPQPGTLAIGRGVPRRLRPLPTGHTRRGRHRRTARSLQPPAAPITRVSQSAAAGKGLKAERRLHELRAPGL